MNKTIKIIIAFGIAIALTATVLVVSLVKTRNAEKTQTSIPLYTLQPTTIQASFGGTEAWTVDINKIAGDLATATDTSATDTSAVSISETMTQPTLPSIEYNTVYNVTSIVYVDQHGNPIDMNQFNTTTTNNQPVYDNTEQFSEPETTTEPDGVMSEFEVNSDGYITKYYGSSSVVIIPSKIQGKTIIGIGSECFKGANITSVQIPETVASVGNAAFQGCIKLRNVIFANPDVEVTIGIAAFKGCESLKTINLPVTSSIGTSAFEGCTSLQSLEIKKGCQSVGQYCFAFCTSLTSLTVNDEATKFNGVSTFQDHNEKLIVRCVSGSDVEFQLKGLGIKTAPITQ